MEAQLDGGPQCGSTAPGSAHLHLFLSFRFFSSWGSSGNLIIGPIAGRIYQGIKELWHTRESPGGLCQRSLYLFYIPTCSSLLVKACQMVLFFFLLHYLYPYALTYYLITMHSVSLLLHFPFFFSLSAYLRKIGPVHSGTTSAPGVSVYPITRCEKSKHFRQCGTLNL